MHRENVHNSQMLALQGDTSSGIMLSDCQDGARRADMAVFSFRMTAGAEAAGLQSADAQPVTFVFGFWTVAQLGSLMPGNHEKTPHISHKGTRTLAYHPIPLSYRSDVGAEAAAECRLENILVSE
ncbi:uncharacterized protein UV8b_07535 [Ustilaginoidea virens]|uniref:Uncharacterized protein n=1 Tax=Ustilaginoidea virens TaxID=1159556 RepID=A0A063BRF7_USTVR|nr:uncharacterized protein UV8b_07535 [Ustilaginoidea virens]QUC23294.1 hypothetical protein UV8b_07535 [Ustilaginoidea virens]GAO14362.1 hypothetical protein UVI_02034350 [Ustilaginoidea virens]